MVEIIQRWRYVVGAVLTAYSFGAAIGITSPTLKLLNPGLEPTGWTRELYASSLNLGVIVGAIIVPVLLSKADGRETLATSFLPSTTGWLLTLASTIISSDGDIKTVDVNLLYIGRLLLGIGGGLSIVHCPNFLHDSHYCKNLSALYQIFLVFGIFAQQVMCALLPIQVITIFNTVACLGIVACLWGGGSVDVHGRGSLASISTDTSSLDDSIHEDNLDEVFTAEPADRQISIDVDPGIVPDTLDNNSESNSLDDSILLNENEVSNDYPVWFAAYVAASQQLCGLNAINFYIIQIFQQNTSSTFHVDSPTLYAIITTFSQFAITLLGGICLYGRARGSEKLNMLSSCAGVVISLAGITAIFWLGFDSVYLMIATIVFQISFSFGLGPTTWTIVAKSAIQHCAHLTSDEQFRSQTRTTSLSAVISQLASFLVVFSFYPLSSLISIQGLFLMYSSFTLLYFIILFIVL